MNLKEFFTKTFEWLITEYNKGALDEVIKEMWKIINLTEDEAKQWWAWAKYLAIWLTNVSVALFLIAAILGGFLHAGWLNALTGLLIAPLLFVLLIWWIPLVAIVAVVGEIANKRLKTIPGAAVAAAKWWLGVTCGVLLWQVVISLAFTFIPYWNAPSRIPILMLLALAMALIGIRWGTSQKYRKVIKALVIATFTIQVAVCFFPHTATAIHGWAGKADKDAAKSINTNGLLPAKAKPAPSPRNLGWQRWEVKPTTNTVVRVYNGDKFIYKSPSAFKILWEGGTEQQSHNPSATPEEARSFEFYNVPAEGQGIKILPVDGTNFWLDFRIERRRTS